MSTPAPAKVVARSEALGRTFHCDVFRGRNARGVMLLFGGSGKSERAYRARETTLNDKLVSWFEREPLVGMHCVYVTAPYDVPYAAPARFETTRERWNQHVREDLFTLFPELPFYLVGYSGGIILALGGAHMDPCVVGAGGLGADGIPEDVEVPLDGRRPRWRLELLYTDGDPVFRFNTEVVTELVGAEDARVRRVRGSNHRFETYLRAGALTALQLEAAGSFSRHFGEA